MYQYKEMNLQALKLNCVKEKEKKKFQLCA